MTNDAITATAEKRARGLYQKFDVTRTDGGSEPGGKHHGCSYFVLDLKHDKHAVPALYAYAESCESDGYQQLADDLRELATDLEMER
jgi:hypothetical protein